MSITDSWAKQQVLIPGRFEDYVENNPIFQSLGLDSGAAIETALVAFTYLESPNALYSLLADQLLDELADRIPPEIVGEMFDGYYNSVRNVMSRIKPRLYGLEKINGVGAEYMHVVDYVKTQSEPYFVVEICYETDPSSMYTL